MISIILPSYNGEKYLSQAIDSILSQTEQDWELILVNDCSTDRTGDICQVYTLKDPRIRVIHNEVNRKLPGSLNRGFREARGDYLTWTSDDNLLEHDALEYLRTELEKGYDFVCSDMTFIDENGNILPGDSKEASIWDHDWIGASFMYRRKVYETVGDYREDMFLVEDYEYWLRVAKAGFQFHYCPRKVYRYRFHEDSLTSKKKRQNRERLVILREEQLLDDRVPEYGKDELRRNLLKDYFSLGQNEKFRSLYRYLWKAKKITHHELKLKYLLRYF